MPFTISGNAGAASVLVSATGAASASATSAADGTYTISGLIPGAYTITPTLAGATFTPASRPETIVAANLTGVNFVAQAASFSPSPTISDNFTRANAANLGPNWTISSFGVASPIAILSNLALPDPTNGYGSERYTKEAFAADQIGTVTIQAFGISSEIDVDLRYDGTNNSGYAAQLAGDGAGGYTINLADFSGSFPGVVFTLGGAPQPGDTLSAQIVGTLLTGFYNGVPVTSATISTSATGAVGMEISETATQTDTSVSLFTAGPELFAISGSVGAAGAGATIVLSGTSSGTTTAAGGTGNYSFTGLSVGNYVITPELTGKEFSPTNRSVTLSNASVSGVNFIVFTPSEVESNSANISSPGQNFATLIQSPRTSVMGTNLRTKIIG